MKTAPVKSWKPLLADGNVRSLAPVQHNVWGEEKAHPSQSGKVWNVVVELAAMSTAVATFWLPMPLKIGQIGAPPDADALCMCPVRAPCLYLGAASLRAAVRVTVREPEKRASNQPHIVHGRRSTIRKVAQAIPDEHKLVDGLTALHKEGGCLLNRGGSINQPPPREEEKNNCFTEKCFPHKERCCA